MLGLNYHLPTFSERVKNQHPWDERNLNRKQTKRRAQIITEIGKKSGTKENTATRPERTNIPYTLRCQNSYNPHNSKTNNTQLHDFNQPHLKYTREVTPVSKHLPLNPTYSYCNRRQDCNTSSRAKMMGTKAKRTMLEIAKNSVPLDKSLILPPYPVTGSSP